MAEKDTQTNTRFFLEKTSDDVKELESYLKDFSVFLPLPFCLVTPTRCILDINNAFEESTGYDRVSIAGQRIHILFDDNKLVNDLFDELDRNGRLDNHETHIKTRDGLIIPINLSAAIRRDNENNIAGYFFAFSDISELVKLKNSLESKVRERTYELEEMQKILIKTLDEVKAAKSKIEKERNKTSAIIANFIDPVIVVDNSWRIIFINPAAKKKFHLTDRNLGQKVEADGDRFSCQAFKDIIQVDFKTRELGKDKEGNPVSEELIIGSDKPPAEAESPFRTAMYDLSMANTVYKVMTAKVCDEKNTCFGRMKIFYDLTREKMVDLLKSEFISIATHQLRTPLSAIKWSISMVLDGDAGELKEEQKKILEKGYLSNERVINVINEMLNASRIEEGRFNYNFNREDYLKIIDEVIGDIGGMIKSRHLKFNFARPKEPIYGFVDKDKIKLAFKHLVENAVTYTPEYGRVEIIAGKDKKCLNLKVIDKGVGIPLSEQPKLYTKFFRSENVVRMQTEGSGLGLFITKNIIIKHDGTIDCRSQEGRGTEFTVTLPISA